MSEHVRTTPPRRSPHQQELFERLYARLGELSTLPTAAIQVINVANDDTTGAEDLLHVVEGDPALAVKILRTVNSAIVSTRHRVQDLKTAVTLLGFREVRNLALTIYVSRMFSSAGQYRCYSRENLWSHHVAVASASRLIAEVCECAPPETAYVAGLLHDVGLILEDQHLRRYFKQVLDRLTDDVSTVEIEHEVLEFDHCELGAYVARHWKLPEPVVAAAAFHHTPLQYEGPFEMIVNIVCVANYLCSVRDFPSLGVFNVKSPPDEVYGRLEIDAHRFHHIMSRLEDTLQYASLAASM